MTVVEAEPGWHGWLGAVLPAHARRFRVLDREIAPLLQFSGAELVDEHPDVEVASLEAIRGDAPVAIVRFGPSVGETSALLPRIANRVSAHMSARSGIRRARRALRGHGFRDCDVLLWDVEQRLRFARSRAEYLRGRRGLNPAERLPSGAIVVASRLPRSPTVLEDAIDAAAVAAGKYSLRLDYLIARASGVLIAPCDGMVLKLAIGPGCDDIRRHREGVELVAATRPAEVVLDRLPHPLGSGEAGLAYWSLESRLNGQPPTTLNRSLLADCLEFLDALNSRRFDGLPDKRLAASAGAVASVCERQYAELVTALATELERELAELPRGIGHGDFCRGNLLAEAGRIRGVVDWSAASQSQLPLLDLINLLVDERGSRHFGRELVTYLLPWAADGGDEFSRAYCQRLGLELTVSQMKSLSIAWWLERVARELATYSDRLRRPVWIQENIKSVLDAVPNGAGR